MPSSKEYQKKIRKRWKREGKCSMCGERPPRLRLLTCTECAVRYKSYHRSLKNRVIEAYGGKCACYGEKRIEFLSIDHPNNNGQEDRKKRGKGGLSGAFYRSLIRDGFPEGYQVACYNCNMAWAFFGYCPHHPRLHRIVERRPKHKRGGK